jgi:hypothetical protein
MSGFLDNIAASLLAAIDEAPLPDRLDIATGFLTPQGLAALAVPLHAASHTRLLLGAEPEPEAARTLRRPGDPPPPAYERRRLQAALATQEAGLRRARDRTPFTLENARARENLVALLRDGRIAVRRLESAYLPGRAMLLHGTGAQTIVGHSNLSDAGLHARPALNLARGDEPTQEAATAWFDAAWDAAVPFDLAALLAEPEDEYPPYLIWLKMLATLYGTDIPPDAPPDALTLTGFQADGVWRANRIMARHGGVLIADEVGLGKTFIGAALVAQRAAAKQNALVVCPAAVRQNWDRALRDVTRRVQVVTFDELARDAHFMPGGKPHLEIKPEDLALVVVDEAHNFRTPEAPYRAGRLRALLGAAQPQVALLTATPVNNSLWDLRNLMAFFLRQDSALADIGFPSLHGIFRHASRIDPADLSPDLLFPVIDAVTVKRTRAYVKRHYPGETIRFPDGSLRPISFPRAIAMTVRYGLDAVSDALFDRLAAALDADNGGTLLAFARYVPDRFHRDAAEEDPPPSAAGLLRSGLLKRFESSAHAFRMTLERMVEEHDRFLAALDKGLVLSTAALRELDPEAALDGALPDGARPAAEYDVPGLRAAVARDRAILAELLTGARDIDETRDPKLHAVVEELAAIAAQADADGVGEAGVRRNRKVLLFSGFADTIAWLRGALLRRIDADPRLAAWRGRVVAVAGAGIEDEDASRAEAVWGFAPETAGPPDGQADRFDLLLATDVLAEGVNLQQCRHIINYDLPWNPMRLVQRHGRIDRIGSPHSRVYLRTVFPAERLEHLLDLEARIQRKLAHASASIGVATAPVQGADAEAHVFSETRREILRLAAGDASIFQSGGTAAATQSGEEYRATLRGALRRYGTAIDRLPLGAGSGVARGSRRGVVFCARVETAAKTHVFLRFVAADDAWQAVGVDGMLAACLRLADCEEGTARHMPRGLPDRIHPLWRAARDHVLAEWERLSDPAETQPKIPRLNRQVAALLRARPPQDVPLAVLDRAVGAVESPWPARETATLREAVAAGASPRALVDLILATGFQPLSLPAPLPLIDADDIEPVCWLAIEPRP